MCMKVCLTTPLLSLREEGVSSLRSLAVAGRAGRRVLTRRFAYADVDVCDASGRIGRSVSTTRVCPVRPRRSKHMLDAHLSTKSAIEAARRFSSESQDSSWVNCTTVCNRLEALKHGIKTVQWLPSLCGQTTE